MKPAEMSRTRGDDCLSDLRFDELLAGELPDGEAASAQEHIEGCERCRERQRELHQRTEQAAKDLPPFGELMESHGMRTEAADGGKTATVIRLSLWWAGAVVAAAAVLVFWMTGDEPAPKLADSRPVVTQPDATRIKGGAHLSFHVRRDGHVTSGIPGQTMLPGDAVRFSVSLPAPSYIAVVSVDAKSVVSVYYPDASVTEERGSGANQALPGAVELDATLGEERVYGVFCDAPTQVAEITAALKANPSTPKFPRECSHELLTWHKEQKP